jgi:hypothetical protein
MPPIYCGNNSQDPELLSGRSVLGTRHSCMKKGFGKGFNMPYDPKFAGPYAPIDERRIYCGNRLEKPNDYDSVGSLAQCIQKGIGIGKRKRAEKGPPRFNKMILPIIIFLIISVGLFTYLYFSKPIIVTTKDSNNIDHIDWNKFLAFYIPTIVLTGVVLFLVFRRY